METPSVGPALERGVYSAFRQRLVASFRQANIGRQVITLDDLQLPTNSVLHVLDQFLSPSITTVMPDLDFPLIKNETYQLYLETLQAIPGKGALFPIEDKFQFRPNQYNQEIRAFWIKNRDIKRASTRAAMLARANTLPILNYNVILTTRMLGETFGYYRHFDLVLRTILDTMVPITGKHQWLVIPLSPTIYRKTQFTQTFDDISYMTVRVRNDPSFFFLIHLINYVAKAATASLFRAIPDEALDTFNIVLTAGDKAVIYNLGDLQHHRDSRQDDNLWQIVLRHVTTLKMAGHANHDIRDLDEKDYDTLVDKMAPVEEPAPGEQPKTATPPAGAPITPITPPVRGLRPGSVPDNALKPPVPATAAPTQKPAEPPPTHTDTRTPKSATAPQPPPSHHPTPPEPPEAPPQTSAPLPLAPTSLVAAIDRGAHETIMSASHLSEEQKVAAMKAAQAYKALLIDGVPIIEHLSQAADPPVATTHLDFLADKVADPSMLRSTAINLDQHYLDHVMAKDIAAVAAQGAAHGMFLVQAEQRDEVTELDRIRHYRLTYQDLTGRRHVVTFKFPIVSSDGTMMIQGIERRMIKQQVNLPICKIDSRRVSLASNYNKTLVERIGTRAHTFGPYISRYIGQVYKAKVGLVLSYGDLTATARLPYDYSSLAKSYSALAFDGPSFGGQPSQYHFFFDYDRRFGSLDETASDGMEAYREPDSTFVHERKTYSLSKLLTETNALPTRPLLVDDLKWVLVYDTPDPARVAAADLTAPILVAKTADGRDATIDGLHRLSKAVAEGILTLPGKIVAQEMLDRAGVDSDTEQHRSRQSLIARRLRRLQELESTYGVYCGTARLSGYTYRMFFGTDNVIRFIGPNRGRTPENAMFATTFTPLFVSAFENKVSPPAALSEWTELKILDRNFPVVFILGFEYGLQRVLDHIKLDYRFVPSGTRISRTPTTIVVPFADGNLVFDRYPLAKSFVMAGLLKFNTRPYAFAAFNSPDVYYTLLHDSGISLNYLKGISDFFLLFIDPITRDVLLRMGEPVEVGRLLLRATEMLTTEDALPSASMRNHRLRGYERFATTLYNEMARSYATYTRQRGNRKSYSINPEAVFLRLIQDQTLHIVEEVNPVENVKDKHAATYTGGGGRTAQSFVIADRQFPADGTGILSEATPDSGKVSMNTYITADPLVANVRGMYAIENVDPTRLEPAQILSVPALLMPGSTNDD